MDRVNLQMVSGVLCLLVLISATVVITGASSEGGILSTLLPNSTGNETISSPSPVTNATVTTRATTAAPKTTVAKTKTPTPAPTKDPYVQIIAPAPVATTPRTHIQPVLPIRSDEGYSTLYSLKNFPVKEQMSRVVVSAVNPPLLVDFHFVPDNITDFKPIDYKMVKTVYHINYTVERPYEHSWFETKVYNNETGEILAQEGVGKLYGLQYDRQFIVPNYGKIAFDIAGQYGNLTMTIKMKKPK